MVTESERSVRRAHTRARARARRPAYACLCVTCRVASLGSELLELQKLQDTEWTIVGDGKGNRWQVGATHKGVVSFWNQSAGWGKIKVRLRAACPFFVSYSSDIMPTYAS